MKILKQIFILLITVLFVFSCTNNTKLNLRLSELKEKYQNEKSENNAIAVGEFYNFSYSKSKEQIEEGLKFIEEALKEHPESIKLNVLLGNLYTRYGGAYAKKFDLTNAMKMLDKGFLLLDSSAEKNPDDSYVLLYRGINSVSVPKNFNRTGIALKDLGKLYSNMDNLPDNYKMLVLLYYSKALKINADNEKAKKVFNELKEKYPDYKNRINTKF